MTNTKPPVSPEDLIPGNYVRASDGSVGRIMADLSDLSPDPTPRLDRPEEYIAVAWDDGACTPLALADITYVGRRPPVGE